MSIWGQDISAQSVFTLRITLLIMLWTKILHQKLNLKRELYQLKMEEGENLMEHVSVFNGVVDQLTKVDVTIEEEDKALFFFFLPLFLTRAII